MKDPLVGAHMSIEGGVDCALKAGKEIGATTIQIFTANQKQWQGKPLSPEVIERWKIAQEETSIQSVMSHDSYLINLGSAKEDILLKSHTAFRQEIERCLALDVTFLNFHPGASLLTTEEGCLDQIVKSLLSFQDLFQDEKLTLLLETTAGQGTQVGYRFEHLAYILERTKGKVPLGVCIDTCHIFAAGYDIRTEEQVNEMLKTFDQVIGLSYLKAFHFNDSMKDFGSRVDRHAPLGEGKIGWTPFRTLMRHPKTQHLPKYLETPVQEKWKEELEQLKEFAQKSHQS